MNDCIFCKIVSGELPSFKIYENETHLAFLDINPNIKATTLVIPKTHVDSTIINLDENIYTTTLQVAKKVAENIAQKLNSDAYIASQGNVEKVGLAIEGTGVAHFHVKLYPFYKETYPGYLSTQMGPQADFKELEELAKKLAF